MNKKTRALLVALACLSMHSATCLFAAAETDQRSIDQKSADKVQSQQESSNMPHPDPSALTFYELRAKAEKGDAQAQHMLGRRYYFGVDVPQNREQAAQWQTKAANQGNAKAQYVLGLLYGAGEGVPQDKKRAAEWISRSAAQGLAEAQFALGMMYLTGEDVFRDAQKAAEWISKAAAQGNEEAKKKRAELNL